VPNKEFQKPANEVGAAWEKTNDKGAYMSVSLDLDALTELRGGEIGGRVDLSMYPLTFAKTNPKAPDHRLLFYPRKSSDIAPVRRPERAAAPLPLDVDIPF
jgi:uncharacterized protein (DUF736 family)